MLEVYSYNAGRGDCIRIRFAETHNIFIDTGVARFATVFRKICNQIVIDGETLDVLILTHADIDHIGGILSNLRFDNYDFPFKEVWMNYDGVATVGDSNLSTRQNNEVVARLKSRGVPIHPTLIGDKRIVADATIDVFWPEGNTFTNDYWRDIPLSHHNDYAVSLSRLAEEPIRLTDCSLSNKYSIIFAFSFENHRLLFTGDAWATDIVRAYGHFDLIKLPHHGSVRNISDDYPTSFHSTSFLVCTDGVNHPDKQTIAKLEKWYKNINIYSSTAWWKHNFFVGDDKNHNINYYQKEGLVVAW